MPREKECFRDMLEQLNIRYPDKEFLNQMEAAQFIGCHPRTISRHYSQYFKEALGISKVQLAKILS